jgi:RHS repeat-associated protein
VFYAPFGEIIGEYVAWYNGNVPAYRFNAKELDEESGLYYFEARYQSPPVFISRDVLFEKYPTLSPYSYCANNPIIFIDPDGRDWYRDDETGSVLWKKGDASFVEKDGARYRNIGTKYSEYRAGEKWEYGNNGYNDLLSVTKVDPSLNLEGGQYIPEQFTTDNGQKVKIDFGDKANNAISPDAISLLIKSINKVNNSEENITSIKVSSTTNHPSNSEKSAHTTANGARAIDISRINNVSVSPTNKYSHSLQKSISSEANWLENYGPSIIQKVHNGTIIEAPWARKIKGGHYDHIHISIPR